jgi:hypothetical protein
MEPKEKSGFELDDSGKFVLELVSSMHAQTNSVANSLIEGLQKEADDLRDIIIEVRNNLEELFSAPYAPSQRAIARAYEPLYNVHDRFWRDREAE